MAAPRFQSACGRRSSCPENRLGPITQQPQSRRRDLRIHQAVTQVQDQALPQTIKLVAILLTIVVLGPLLAGYLVNGARDVFNEFPTIASSGGTSQR